QTIIDTIKHVGMDQNRYRTLLPGATYRQPPKQEKLDPFTAENSKQLIALGQQFPNREVLAQNIQKEFQGFGKVSALQLADVFHQNDGQNDSEHLTSFLKAADAPIPSLTTGKRLDFTFTALGNDIQNMSAQFGSLSGLLDHFYREKATRDRVRQQGALLIHVVNQELKKNRNKLKKLQKEFANTQHADEYRIKGELLTTYLYQVKRGMT